jgi:hypothetical protein
MKKWIVFIFAFLCLVGCKQAKEFDLNLGSDQPGGCSGDQSGQGPCS